MLDNLAKIKYFVSHGTRIWSQACQESMILASLLNKIDINHIPYISNTRAWYFLLYISFKEETQIKSIQMIVLIHLEITS